MINEMKFRIALNAKIGFFWNRLKGIQEEKEKTNSPRIVKEESVLVCPRDRYTDSVCTPRKKGASNKQRKVFKTGNSHVVSLPKEIPEPLGVTDGSDVSV